MRKNRETKDQRKNKKAVCDDVAREVDGIDKSIVVDIGDGSTAVKKLAESESLVRVVSSY